MVIGTRINLGKKQQGEIIGYVINVLLWILIYNQYKHENKHLKKRKILDIK